MFLNRTLKSLSAIMLIFWVAACQSQKNSNTDTAGDTIMNIGVSTDDYFGEYTLEDEEYGTKTTVTIKNGKRIMSTNSLPNHETGNFPNPGNPNTIAAQNRTYEFPLEPEYTGKPQWAREPGVALNGIKFEPGTAEVVVCKSGENYRVEAIQDLIDLGLDFNNAHVQPTGAYHYHGSPAGVIKAFDTGEDLVHIGFAHDGFPIYYSKSGTYKSSYQLFDEEREGTDCEYSNPHQSRKIDIQSTLRDGTFGSDYEYIPGLGDLDECNGINLDGQYLYLVTNEYPYVGRCLMGAFEAQRGPGPPPGGRAPRGSRPPRQRG